MFRKDLINIGKVNRRMRPLTKDRSLDSIKLPAQLDIAQVRYHDNSH